MKKIYHFWIGLILTALLAAACSPSIPVTGGLIETNAAALAVQKSTINALETLAVVPPSATATETATVTLTPTPTHTATVTPTLNPAFTLTPTPTSTVTVAFTATSTASFTPTPSSTNTPTPTPTSTNTPTPTFTPTPTPVVVPCNKAEFVADVTIPDGTLLDAGVAFTKTWRLRNVGTCTWLPTYKIVFTSGDQLGGPDYIYLGTSIIPGQTIDISLNLIAPDTNGTYKGSYKLADAGGTTFGVGNSANNAFFVVIQQGTSPATYAQVRPSTTRIQAGNDLTIYVSGFPAKAEIDYRVGKLGEDYSLVYDGTVGSDGTTSKTITIPVTAVSGEYWVVQVLTTSLLDVVTVSSHSIYITNTYVPPYTGDLQVSLSSTQAHAGDAVIVYVRGFPANAEIDLRVGEQGKNPSVIYDGTVGSNGTTIQTIVLPTSALNGQYWIVQVTTTNQQNAIAVTSHTIYITN